MKKIIVAIYFFVLSVFSFSYSIEDYNLYISAKKSYENNEFEDAVHKFELLERTYSSSPIVKENYYSFYYALALLKTNQPQEAINLMVKSNHDLTLKFYYLSTLYLSVNDIPNAVSTLKLLFFRPNLSKHFQDFAYDELINLDSKNKLIYDLIYKKDFSNINKIKEEDLVKSGSFLLDRNEVKFARKVFENLYSRDKYNESYIENYLKILFILNDYEATLKVSENMLKILQNPTIYYYRGKAFLAKKDYSLGIFNLTTAVNMAESFNNSPIIVDARETLFNIHYSFENKEEINELAKKNFIPTKNIELVLINTKFRNLEYDDAFIASAKFIKKYPYTYESGYLYLLLNYLDFKNDKNTAKKISNFEKIQTTELIAQMVNNIVNKSRVYNLSILTSLNDTQFESFFEIARLGDINLLNIAINNSLFLVSDNIKKTFIKTQLYQANENFESAYKNSLTLKNEFYKYSNLITYLYPQYFQDIVSDEALKYSIPSSVLYTLILTEKQFKLKNPKVEIENTAKKFAEFKKKYNGDVQGMIAYLYGEEVLGKIYFENNDFYLERISDSELRNNLSTLVTTYLFYKVLY